MTASQSDARLRWAWLLLLLLLPMLVWLLDFGAGRPKGTPVREPAPDTGALARAGQAAAPSSATQRARTPATSRPQPAQLKAPVAGCPAYARKGCHRGDVWWFDACGQASERVEACEGRPCLGLGCAPASWPSDACGEVSAVGRCDGDVARVCLLGRVSSVDCAADGERCAITSEGARCLPRTRLDCSPETPATCDGQALVRCVDGRLERVDCAYRLGRCAVSDGRVQCIGTQLAEDGSEPVERCNGTDDDLDDETDEGGVCDAIPLVAFVAGGRVPDGFTAMLQRELATLQRVYHPRTFTWLEAVPDSAPEQVELRMLDELSSRLSRSRSRDEFFIPVLFVDAIRTRPETSGQSMLPNGSCGGVRISDRLAAPDGLVVVSEKRTPETLAHELGHYLGLCHTHDEVAALGLATPAAECELSGDAICDTAFDPGPEQCALQPGCDIACKQSARPDVSNVMSYYMPCRRGLSADQLAIVERGIQLRRAWFRCLDQDGCACMPGDPAVCPLQMSCRPARDDGSGTCGLDGPALPGAHCQDSAECSGGAVCIGAGAGAARVSRCVRACRESTPDCTCSDAGLPFRVCGEDTG